MNRFIVRKRVDDGGEALYAVVDTGTRRVVAQYTREILGEIAANRLNDAEARYVERVTSMVRS